MINPREIRSGDSGNRQAVSCSLSFFLKEAEMGDRVEGIRTGGNSGNEVPSRAKGAGELVVVGLKL